MHGLRNGRQVLLPSHYYRQHIRSFMHKGGTREENNASLFLLSGIWELLVRENNRVFPQTARASQLGVRIETVQPTYR
ncbi:hypothetical protein EYF80_014745 [Liparis tanakae]|uniref:Uncharacterized protein n=1 Tax=Liparis tanakae TaxID=230148 RepID=A0A4Z2IAA0_9TELE|nr:hypothetical protein EYF80_014745 [Liparis tanakae]